MDKKSRSRSCRDLLPDGVGYHESWSLTSAACVLKRQAEDIFSQLSKGIITGVAPGFLPCWQCDWMMERRQSQNKRRTWLRAWCIS